MFSKKHTKHIRTGVTDPGADKDHPYRIYTIRKDPYQINKGKHHRRVSHTEKGAHDLLRMIFGKGKHIQKHKCN